MTLIQFIIINSIAVICIGISILIDSKHNQGVDSALGTTLMFFGCIIIFICGILIPTLATNKDFTKYQKISNPEILIGEYSIVINENELSGTYTSQQYFPASFNSHRIKNEINDSTQFFLLTKRSFYRLPMERKVVWSNPPYKIFYDE